MGRHQKKGLDYFPLDVYMDDSVALLEVDHGLEGFAILIKLYQKIYANGYYIHVSDKELKLLSRNINVDINQLNAIINSAVCYHLFDKCLHEKYQILTSSGIQNRYLFAVERRISVNFIKQFLLLDENVYINMKNVNIKEINVAEIGINDNRSTHIKLKNSKLKNIKKETALIPEEKPKKTIKNKYGEYKHVLLTEEQFEGLKTKVDNRALRIKNLDEYLEMHKKKHYDNHNLTIQNWYRNDENKNPPKIQPYQPEIVELTEEDIKANEDFLAAGGVEGILKGKIKNLRKGIKNENNSNN